MDDVTKYFDVLIALVMAAIGFGYNKFQISQNKTDIKELEDNYKRLLFQTDKISLKIEVLSKDIQAFQNIQYEEKQKVEGLQNIVNEFRVEFGMINTKLDDILRRVNK